MRSIGDALAQNTVSPNGCIYNLNTLDFWSKHSRHLRRRPGFLILLGLGALFATWYAGAD